MPCYTDPPTQAEETEARLRELVNEILGKKFNHKSNSVYGTGSRVQEYTRTLCEWCKLNERKIGKMSLELQIWWRDHQEEDARHESERLERQRQRVVRKQALAKLSPEERKILKVD